ncbi:MAG: hypothetical protein AAB899_04700 [Patescibacteria group bacterium]
MAENKRGKPVIGLVPLEVRDGLIYLSRIASEMKECTLSFPSDADSKGENPAACRGKISSRHVRAESGPGLALGLETFHISKLECTADSGFATVDV